MSKKSKGKGKKDDEMEDEEDMEMGHMEDGNKRKMIVKGTGRRRLRA